MDSWEPISVLAAKVQKGELKAVGLVRKSLERIEKNQDFDAIISKLEEPALKRAALKSRLYYTMVSQNISLSKF